MDKKLTAASQKKDDDLLSELEVAKTPGKLTSSAAGGSVDKGSKRCTKVRRVSLLTKPHEV
jgi:hypothetical protein